ncbi:MAG TPA: hypothetical protein HA343_05710 [Methanomassiliicoccales archaeon]|jgi:hypothetical protein|nr:hypothetical protein [Methanomassiliicoccales archaeon]
MSEGEGMRPHLEVHLRESTLVLPCLAGEERVHCTSLFGDWHGATVLCSCGSLVRLDQAAVHRRRKLGKPVECHHCRNRRVALEKEELDMEFYDREGE